MARTCPGLDEHQGELPVEHVPDRLPIYAGRFEGDGLALVVCRQHIANRFEQAPVVEEIDSAERRKFDGVEMPPRAFQS
jgi:hypothetical protein